MQHFKNWLRLLLLQVNNEKEEKQNEKDTVDESERQTGRERTDGRQRRRRWRRRDRGPPTSKNSQNRLENVRMLILFQRRYDDDAGLADFRATARSKTSCPNPATPLPSSCFFFFTFPSFFPFYFENKFRKGKRENMDITTRKGEK